MENSQPEAETEVQLFVPYSHFEAMTDIELVMAAQAKNNQAFSVLFDKYQIALERKAKVDAAQYPSIGWKVFYDENVALFYRAVRKMDVNIGTFKGWLGKKLTNAKYNVLRSKYYRNIYDDEGNRIKQTDVFISMDAVKDSSRNNTNPKVYLSDERLEVDYNDEEANTELFQFIASKSEKDAQSMYLKSQGYTLEQIGQIVGGKVTTGNQKMWATRSLERCQKLAVEFYQTNGINPPIK